MDQIIKNREYMNKKINKNYSLDKQNISISPAKTINDISLKIELDTKDKNILSRVVEKKTDKDVKMTLINKDYSF
jgi:hypothetical protein